MQAELNYLFTPADHDSGCFALFGFLNDPTDESYQPRVCEAGVMLYFRQRLIRKLECTFPDAPKSIDASLCPRRYFSDCFLALAQWFCEYDCICLSRDFALRLPLFNESLHAAFV